MNGEISAERPSDLIGLICDCVIDPARWQPAVDTLREMLDVATAKSAVVHLPDGEPLVSAVSGVAPAWLQRFQEARAAHGIEIRDGPERLQDYPLAEPIVLSRAVGRAHMTGNPMQDQFAKPPGLSDVVSMRSHVTRAASPASARVGPKRAARSPATTSHRCGCSRRNGTPPLVAHVLPLQAGELRHGISQRALAAVFIADAAVPKPMPAQALAPLHDLTPAEVHARTGRPG